MIAYPNVKVNLGLSVLRKRPDGYHDLETLFVPWFGFHDTLEIIADDDYSRTSASLFAHYEAGAGSVFIDVAEGGTSLQGSTEVLPTLEKCSEACDLSGVKPASAGRPGRDFCAAKVGKAERPRGILGGGAPSIAQAIREDGKVMVTIARKEGVDWNPLEDLTVKAYALLDKDFGLPPVKVFLEKTSPVGAGLGGGSADAAFALKMLDELFSLHLDDAALASYAARLGSDCAFFIYNRPMLGTGRGEILEPFSLGGIDFSGRRENPDAAFDLRIVIPEGVAVSTADAYRGIAPRDAGGIAQCTLIEALSRPVCEWKDCLVNDFESTVFAKYPEIAAVKQRLYDDGAVYAAMSGSGSSVFGLFRR